MTDEMKLRKRAKPQDDWSLVPIVTQSASLILGYMTDQ